MKLWTWHGPDFSLTSGRVDHSRSSYYTDENLPKIPCAYAELARRLGTDQIIWCYVSPNEYIKTSNDTRVEWVLEVPDDKLFSIIDSFIWNRIIDRKTYPDSLREKWAYEAIETDDYNAYLERNRQKYDSQTPPKGGWWEALFITDINTEGATVLLKHPIPDIWIVRSPDINVVI
jgi:hypothetical protein